MQEGKPINVDKDIIKTQLIKTLKEITTKVSEIPEDKPYYNNLKSIFKGDMNEDSAKQILNELKSAYEKNWKDFYSTETDYILSLDEFNNKTKVEKYLELFDEEIEGTAVHDVDDAGETVLDENSGDKNSGDDDAGETDPGSNVNVLVGIPTETNSSIDRVIKEANQKMLDEMICNECKTKNLPCSDNGEKMNASDCPHCQQLIVAPSEKIYNTSIKNQ